MSELEFNMDLSNVGAVMGSITGTMEAVKTKVYIKDLIRGAQHQLGAHFNTHMTLLALTQPQRFHHVYEWNHVGQPAFRLWKNTYVGTSKRVTSFEFLPSHVQVPLPDPEFPPGPKGQQVHRRYIFWNKARVMEYNIPVHIYVKEAKALFINLRDNPGVNLPDNHKGFTFAQQATIFNRGATAGSFTNAFIEFYREQAPVIFKTEIQPVIEQSVEKNLFKTTRASRAGTRVGWKSYQISYDAGREMARSESLIEAARWGDSAFDEAYSGAFE